MSDLAVRGSATLPGELPTLAGSTHLRCEVTAPFSIATTRSGRRVKRDHYRTLRVETDEGSWRKAYDQQAYVANIQARSLALAARVLRAEARKVMSK